MVLDFHVKLLESHALHRTGIALSQRSCDISKFTLYLRHLNDFTSSTRDLFLEFRWQIIDWIMTERKRIADIHLKGDGLFDSKHWVGSTIAKDLTQNDKESTMEFNAHAPSDCNDRRRPNTLTWRSESKIRRRWYEWHSLRFNVRCAMWDMRYISNIVYLYLTQLDSNNNESHIWLAKTLRHLTYPFLSFLFDCISTFWLVCLVIRYQIILFN